MKYLLTLTLLLLCFLSFYSCGDDTINRVYTSPDFDIYLVKRDIQNSISSTYTIKSDGTDPKLFNDSMVVNGNSYKNKILLTKGGYSYNDIYIANYNGSLMTKIPLGNYQASFFSLSPDALKLYFIEGFLGMGLYIVNTDGSGLVEITDLLSSIHSVKFSPSGNMIAFLEPSYNPNHRGTKLFISNTSGTYKKLLKDSLQDGGSVDWSNDGKRIIFHYLPVGMHDLEIGIIDTSLSNFSVLGYGAFPSWSPVSGKICYVNYTGSWSDIFLMDQDGTNIINATNTPNTSEYNVKWSKDGLRILYRAYEGSNPPKLWMYDLNTNSNTFLADSVYDAVWQ